MVKWLGQLSGLFFFAGPFDASAGSALHHGDTDFPSIKCKLSGTDVLVPPPPYPLKIDGQFAGEIPVGQLQSQEHASDIHLVMGHDRFNAVESIIRCYVGIGGKPFHPGKLNPSHLGCFLSNVYKIGLV